ncbi:MULTISPECIES: alpha/beta hydrolase [Alphaproteobacteria]|uniref:Phospholipase n=2 Tax=Alphaproteobacteria TaxID=28211 RepID=A0A512HD21_9HYPH|nr:MULTISPECIES: prolyl oligopeptidase family serine peptidase [Alphaproteobacteria]GEO83344.1 phospholipase [Ciceribacter naphthalenivorans]GLR20262.1 phospholipase [Ciceribacter naphthalenivorans]GLT03118.1 phospholipase [Sphingomonas psychrolutea]
MQDARNLVILLHGVGSSGADLLPLSDMWKGSLPGTAFAAPDAPFPFPYGMGHQWFSIAGVTEENRAGRIEAARADFDRVIGQSIDAFGFAKKLDRVAFVGFSQGTIMALDALASGRWPVGAIVGFSGRLASPVPLSPGKTTPVLLVHGGADSVIPAAETVKAAATLHQQGVDVESRIIPALEHTISAKGAELAGEFLASHLA